MNGFCVPRIAVKLLKKQKLLASIWMEGMGDIFGLYKGKWVTANGAVWFYNALSQDA